ncbi:MAG: hypothetical protein IJD81_06810 [Oscillospiraceae bacterium]|nr:hypothetical protein [Oscillospiraceae bacterium]
MIRAAILVSGDCRLTRRLLDSAFFNEIENLKISGVISSNPDAQALTRARNLRVPTFVVDEHLFPHAASYGQALLNKLRDIDTDIVILDGFVPKSGNIAKHFKGRVFGVKLTPVQQSMEITVYKADAQGDVGERLGEAVVTLQEEDTPDSFARKVYEQGETLLLEAVCSYCAKHI